MSLDEHEQEVTADIGGEIQSTAGESADAFFQADRAVPAIEFRHVHLAFDDKVILDGVSFKVRRGETKIILGRSGSGKSTIIRLVLGLTKPDDGEILIDGEDITYLTEAEMMQVRNKIGMVFQEGALFDSIPVYDNVGYRLHEKGIAEDIVEEKVKQMLSFVDLEDAIAKMPSELSGGMRRRVGIARALVGDPQIVLFDEPTAGLDPPTARTICELAIKLRDIQDVSSIFVTHEMNNLEYLSSEYAILDENNEVVFEEEGERLCLINTEIIMLKEGKLIFSGKEEELRMTDDPYIRRFLNGK
ncbi:MAG: ATP-binding cassette domain-containing protein [Pyrinomonadaceae bacterium]